MNNILLYWRRKEGYNQNQVKGMDGTQSTRPKMKHDVAQRVEERKVSCFSA